MLSSSNTPSTDSSKAGIFSYKELDLSDPRDKGLWHMLRTTICPNLTLKSFITFVTFANTVAFLCQLYFDGIKIPGKFLEVKEGRMIDNLGRIYGGIRTNHQFWRSLTCLFLHASFTHIFYNTISTLIWGSLLEKLVGESFWRMVVFWVLTGISGDFFSSWFQASNVVSVGASTAIFGLFGIMIGFLFLNWNRLPESDYSRKSVATGIGFIVLFNVGVIGMDVSHNVDNFAHIGGFISGIFVGMVFADLPNSKTEKFEKRIKVIGGGLYILFTALCLAMIFLFENKSEKL